MKSILILANSLVELFSFRIELVDRLISDGYKVVVSAPMKDDFADRLRAKGVEFIETNITRRGTNPVEDISLLRHYLKLINQVKPDVILSYTIKPNIYGGFAARIKGIPQIANITGLGTAVENGGWLQRLTVGLYRSAFAKTKSIFFQNEGNRKFFVDKNLRIDAHRVIPGSGVNLSRFTLSPYPGEDEPVRFLFISRIMKQKGIEEYFAAAEHFKLLDPSLEFHILGDCEEDYRERLAEMQAKGLVIWHGRQKDVRPFIERSHCLIHPTYYPEGMSNVILESAATGRPVITTRRHGCMEAVDDGITGYLFEERDRKGLIARVGEFLSLPYSEKVKMGQKAADKMKNQFDRQIVVNAYLDEINKI